MPALDCRIMPARSIRRWETICASLGFSRSVGMKNWDRRITILLNGETRATLGKAGSRGNSGALVCVLWRGACRGLTLRQAQGDAGDGAGPPKPGALTPSFLIPSLSRNEGEGRLTRPRLRLAEF